jgi:hypothetical protein
MHIHTHTHTQTDTTASLADTSTPFLLAINESDSTLAHEVFVADLSSNSILVLDASSRHLGKVVRRIGHPRFVPHKAASSLALSPHTRRHISHTHIHLSRSLVCPISLSLSCYLSLCLSFAFSLSLSFASTLSPLRTRDTSLARSISPFLSLARSLARSLSVPFSPTHFLIRCMQFASRSLSLARVRALSLLRHPPSNDQEAKRNDLVAALKCVPCAYSRTRDCRVNRLRAHDCMHSHTRVLCVCARVLNANNTAKRASDCIRAAGNMGLAPRGLAVDPRSGNVFVSCTSSHRYYSLSRMVARSLVGV